MKWMDRAKILNDVWSYLPTFRVVAETEHLPTAAARLHVVPSALSRSVRLLEDALGGAVFERRGRRLVLNARGRALLEAIQQGTVALERGLARATGGVLEGELVVGTIGVLTNHVVLPSLLALVERWPGVVPSMRVHGPKEANHRLAIGNLDVAFYYDATPMDGIWCERLGALTASVYCGRTHPLFGARAVTPAQLARHPFSVPQVGDRGLPMDGWPVHLSRTVGFRIELLSSNVDVCASGRFLTVLPDVGGSAAAGRAAAALAGRRPGYRPSRCTRRVVRAMSKRRWCRICSRGRRPRWRRRGDLARPGVGVAAPRRGHAPRRHDDAPSPAVSG
jgi:DNA-binding transcriptional LysR family regulator